MGRRRAKADAGNGVAADGVVWKGPVQIRPALVAIGDLYEDLANARMHDEASVAAIAASLGEFGQQRPILTDAECIVRAGNGTLLAARRLGWTHLAAVRTDLTGAALRGFSLADNRTAELSCWDDTKLLEQLRSLQSEERPCVHATGFADAWIDGLADRLAQARLESSPADETDPPPPDFRPGDASDQGRLDEPGQTECPACGEVFTPSLVRARRG